MDNSPKQTIRWRPTLGALAIFLTVAGISASGLGIGCGPSGQGPQAAYQTRLAAGAEAAFLLGGGTFKRLTVEIQAVKGYAPTAEALTHFQHFLENRLQKPGGITVTVSSDSLTAGIAAAPPSPSPSASANGSAATGYSTDDMRSLEQAHRTQHSLRDSLSVYFLFLDGAAAADTDATQSLGEAYGNTSVTVFEATVRGVIAKNPALPLWMAEATVMEHQFSRLLGLVANPVAALSHHEDTAHPGRCATTDCLMNARFETANGLATLAASPRVPELDATCLQDLKQAGGK